MAERTRTEELSDAESELIYILRHSKDFTIRVHVHHGQYDVDLEIHDPPRRHHGRGLDFDMAWEVTENP